MKNPEMSVLESIDRFMNWSSRHSRAMLAALTAAVTAVGGAFGPAWVEGIKERIERHRARSELITKVMDATATLDPFDPKTVLRFGVVADLISDNGEVLGLKIDQAAGRLARLGQDLRRGSIGVLDAAVDRRRREVQQLAEAVAGLRSAAEKIRHANTMNAVTEGEQRLTAPGAARSDVVAIAQPDRSAEVQQTLRMLGDTLEAFARRQEALRLEAERAQEAEREARSDFSKSLEDATRQHQETERLLASLQDLKSGLAGSMESQQRALARQVDAATGSLTQTVRSVGARFQTDLATLSAERDALAQRRQEISSQGLQLAQQRHALAAEWEALEQGQRMLEARAARRRDQSCERTDFELFREHMARMQPTPGEKALKDFGGLTLLNPESDSGDVKIAIRYVKLNQGVQKTLDVLANHLTQLDLRDRDVVVRGYVFQLDRATNSRQQVMKDSLTKAFGAYDYLTRQFRMRSNQALPRFAVSAAGPPPAANDDTSDRVELTVSERVLPRASPVF